MSFGAPVWLWALLVLPAAVLLFLRAEQRSASRLRDFVAPRLLAQLGATVSRFRRGLRFGLLLLGLALAFVSLAKPRAGYTYAEVKRKGLDLIIALDTSRSMLANDVPPNRLARVKLAAQDLISEMGGDRVGLIAFAGSAFLQAPLTIDYDAAVEALNDIDTNSIPEGGTNISEAITLATGTFGKSAMGNRALIIFTDGEELAGDAVKLAKDAADAGVRIFTIGVGTPEGSLIPVSQAPGQVAFVKDRKGQVVKSKLDEKRLREIAETTGGMYLLLQDGPGTMRKLYDDGITKMQAGDIDTRSSRQPIERYQWPLAGALLALGASLLLNERKRISVRSHASKPARNLAAAAALIFVCAGFARAAAPGLDEYRNDRYAEAYDRFQQTLRDHPETSAADKIQFDAGAAAYKMKDYGKALESFSQALLSPDRQLQSRSHYNLGNTLYQRGETQKGKEEKLKDWENALQHYDQTLKLESDNKKAKENADFVKNKVEELKKQQQQQPSPTPSPKPSPKQDQKKQDQKKEKNQKQQDQSGKGEDQKPEENQDQKDQEKQDQSQSNQTPTPSPSPGESNAGTTPSPSPGSAKPSPSPSAGEEGNASPSPSPSESEKEQSGSEENSPTPAPTPSGSPEKKPTGEVKGNSGEQPTPTPAEAAEAEEEQELAEDKMSEQQAERLLRSMRDEEQRVQLGERKTARRVYDDW